jgi:predicted glycoside hydrolase/deacetylase ChbG (UPF0249 family)
MIDPQRRQLLHSLKVLAAGSLAAAAIPNPIPRAMGRASAREQKTLAERLGYRADEKLLIIHADDLAVAHSVNAASIIALESGAVSSASIMVTCPWLTEIAEYARAHPRADLGLHLTLTSEWAHYRWGPVSPLDRVPTLIARDGYFYRSAQEAIERISPAEAEVEIRAQIEKARAFGINPTHLDSHMGTLFKTKDLFEALLRVGRDYKLPVLASKDFFSRADFFENSLGPDSILLDRLVTISPNVAGDHWAEFYGNAIRKLQPGVTEVLIHLAYDDEEMRAVTVNHPDWGAAWRQRDFDFFTGGDCHKLLIENDIRLITWREIGKLIYG